MIRGNSLSLEVFEAAWTAAAVPFLEKHGDTFNQPEPKDAIQTVSMAVPKATPITQAQQLVLF